MLRVVGYTAILFKYQHDSFYNFSPRLSSDLQIHYLVAKLNYGICHQDVIVEEGGSCSKINVHQA